LYAALAFDQIQQILAACGADLEQIRKGMENYFEQKVPVRRMPSRLRRWDSRASWNAPFSSRNLPRMKSWTSLKSSCRSTTRTATTAPTI
jgi:hypothetical protein